MMSSVIGMMPKTCVTNCLKTGGWADNVKGVDLENE